MYTFKKSLGQHFLKDEQICKKIIEELKQVTITNLVEVGPGGGALTKYLLKIPDINFKAVEIDTEKVNYLTLTYPSLREKIIQANFLEIHKPFDGPFSIIGNFPYNISTEILFKILEWIPDVEFVIGMFQKEVALRIAAHEGNKIYGVTSVLVQAFYDVTYLFDVSENSFTPAPKVKSGVIKLALRKKQLEISSRDQYFNLVKKAFGQRRKTLRNACKNLFDLETLKENIFDKRAEQLSIEDFADLTHKMK